MLFAIPSKGRAGKVKTTDVLTCGVLYVPEAEVCYYRKSNGLQKIVGVPDEIKGITKTRNHILQTSEDKRVVMVDDDVKNQGWVNLLPERSKHKKMKELEWVKVSEQMFDMVEDLGWKIWGVATQSAPRSVYPYKPILTRSYVTASFMGVVNDGTYLFDERYKVKEDYEIGLRHAKEFGGIVAARHCYWENGHWLDEGGCHDYRTGGMELECIRMLIKEYPGQIRRVARGGSGYSIDLEW